MLLTVYIDNTRTMCTTCNIYCNNYTRNAYYSNYTHIYIYYTQFVVYMRYDIRITCFRYHSVGEIHCNV